MLAVHFKMFSREERAAVEPVLQRLLDGLCADITAVAVEYDRLQIRDRYYGDADFRIRRVESTLPAEDRIGDGVALILQDVSANWRAASRLGWRATAMNRSCHTTLSATLNSCEFFS